MSRWIVRRPQEAGTEAVEGDDEPPMPPQPARRRGNESRRRRRYIEGILY
jgi:hypothetical protein